MVTILENDRDSYPFTCNICGLKIKLKASFERHVRIKHDDGLYKCQNCMVKCITRNELNIHIKSIHKQFQCDECEFNTSLPCKLKIHKNSKHLGIKYPCEVCGLEFTLPQVRRKHIRSVHISKKKKCK